MNSKTVSKQSIFFKRGGRLIITFITTLIILAIIASLITVSYVSWQLTHPQKKKLYNFANNELPQNELVNFKDINNEIDLVGNFFPANNSNKTVVVSHGYRLNRYMFDGKFKDFANDILKNGYNLFIFDFRNSGESSGNITTNGYKETNDLKAAINFIKTQKNSEKIISMGFSMGAITCIIEGVYDQNVDVIIADSPFCDMEEYLNENLSLWTDLPQLFNKPIFVMMRLFAGVDPKTVSPKREVKNLKSKPLFLIHGNADTTIPIKNSELIYNSAIESGASNIEFWEVEGVKHISAYPDKPEEFIKKVTEFLNKHGM